MSYEPQNEMRAHVQAVVAAGIPLFGEDLSDTDNAELGAYLHALNTHMNHHYGRPLWNNEEGFIRARAVATILGREILRTWDGEDYDWEQGVERFVRRLDIKWK